MCPSPDPTPLSSTENHPDRLGLLMLGWHHHRLCLGGVVGVSLGGSAGGRLEEAIWVEAFSSI